MNSIRAGLKYTIILDEPYPYGMACSNRIHLYAKGLLKVGAIPDIIVPKPKIIDRKLDVLPRGKYDGVDYQYASKIPYRSNSFIKRRFADFLGSLWTAFLCIKQKPDVVLFVGGGYLNILIYKIACLISKSLLYREKSEIPYMEKDSINRWHILRIKHNFSFFDGLIVITDALGDFFTKDLKIRLKTITIPILIEAENPVQLLSFEDRKEYILYTGSLLDRKDGVITLLNAFAIVSKKYPKLKLYITGDATQSTDYKKIIKCISNLQLDDKIIFTGFVTQEDLVQLINEAKISILIKPKNRQNTYNFPTKIGEYMITGCPVISTRNETLEKIFQDKKNVFFTDFSAQEIAGTISFVFNNKELAENVGFAARGLVKGLFNTETQMKRLNDFFIHERN